MHNPTIEKYTKLADEIIAFEAKLRDLHQESTNLLGKTRGESHRFFRLADIASKIKSNIEDDMYRQNPGLSRDYLNVFYGSPAERKAFRCDLFGSDEWTCEGCGCKLWEGIFELESDGTFCHDCFQADIEKEAARQVAVIKDFMNVGDQGVKE